MARFTETVDIRQAPTIQADSSGLTRKLDEFSARKTQVLANKIASNAFEEGKGSFAKGQKPEFKEEKFFGKLASSSYNKGLRASYVASVDADNRQEIARISAENPTNLAKYNDEIENYRKSTLLNVDPSARDIVADSMDSLINANRIKVQNNEINLRHKENVDAMSSQIDMATTDALGFARDGDPITAAESALAASATIDAAVDMGAISPADGEAQKRDIDRGMVEEGFKGDVVRLFDSDGAVAAYSELDKLSGNRPKGFSPDEWNKFIGETQTELNRKLARQERQFKIASDRAKKDVDFSAIEARIAGDDSQIINVKLADQYYQERVAPAIETLPPEARQAAQAQYMDRLKVIPSTINKQIANAANSNNPDLAVEAASLVDRIEDIPGLVSQIPNTEQAYLQNVTNLMENMAPEEAVELARRATDPKDKARIEVAKESIKVAKKETPDLFRMKSQEAFSSGLFGFGGPESDSVSGAQMAKEYGDVWESLVKAGMSESDAFDKAGKTIKRNWGTSSALGTERIMKYPPENYYAIDNDSSWMQRDMAEYLDREVAGIDVSVSDVILMGNDVTARTATTGKPSYAVKALINGSFIPIGQWSPDLDAEIDRRKAQSVKDVAIERANSLQRRIDNADIAAELMGIM